ncbi:NERD domain-containing protein [Chloroflexia bacterium SDU3-3]|nr:NERD domain-containing protein [Chloroflexia bacterium SDU3-3]
MSWRVKRAMSDLSEHENSKHRKKRLDIFRRRLYIELEQKAQMGIHTPSHVILSIQDIRSEIAQIKMELRSYGVFVDDDPADIATPEETLADKTYLAQPNVSRLVVCSNWLTERDERDQAEIAAILTATLVAILLTIKDFVFFAFDIHYKDIWTALFTPFICLTFGSFYVFWKLRPWLEIRRRRKTQAHIVERLREVLDDQWTIYQSLYIPQASRAFDLVLVAPYGVWVIQMITARGAIRFEKEHWYVETKRGWKNIDKQIELLNMKDDASALEVYFDRQGIQQTPYIAIASDQNIAEKDVDQSPIDVWIAHSIKKKTQNLRTETLLSQAEIEQMNKLLEKRAIEQLAIEDDLIRRGKQLRDKPSS